MRPTGIARSHPGILRAGLIAVLWLALISFLHFHLNVERRHARKVLMGYMPVITNLAAPLVDAASRRADPRFEAVKFGSFAEMGEAFKSGHIDVAFMIAPLAVAMAGQGVPLKIVYIGNRHESTLVVRKDLDCRTFADLTGRTVAVPMRYAGHLLAVRRLQRKMGMDEEAIRIVEIPPPDMAPALASGGIDGYVVGEPFAARAIRSGVGVRLLDVEDAWPGFICNLMIVRESLIVAHPDWVQKLVTAAVRAGFWAERHIDEAVDTACRYWGQDPDVVRYVLSTPPGRVRFDMYAPVAEELEEVGREMAASGLLEDAGDIRSLIDDRFAKAADAKAVDALGDILPR